VAAPLRRCPKSAAELMSTRRQPHASLRSGHLNCPRCGLSIAVRPHRTAIRHCPRCVGRSRVLVELFSSALPADVLYEEGSLPQVDGETAFSGDTSASAKDPHPAERRRAQVVDKLRRAEPLPPPPTVRWPSHFPPSVSVPHHSPDRGRDWPPARPAPPQDGQAVPHAEPAPPRHERAAGHHNRDGHSPSSRQDRNRPGESR
jgi:hypothetical protein